MGARRCTCRHTTPRVVGVGLLGFDLISGEATRDHGQATRPPARADVRRALVAAPQAGGCQAPPHHPRDRPPCGRHSLDERWPARRPRIAAPRAASLCARSRDGAPPPVYPPPHGDAVWARART
eukprot:2347357-Prymnesium_polylepis.1